MRLKIAVSVVRLRPWAPSVARWQLERRGASTAIGGKPMDSVAEQQPPRTFDVVPVRADRFCAEVTGVDLRAVAAAKFAAIHRAWIDHQVLLFRGQALTDADLIAFSRRFGELDHAPIQENGRRFVDGMPEMYVVSNVIEGGVA